MDSSIQPDLDARILTYYGQIFDEGARLTTRSAQGPLEFQRTQDMIRETVSGGRILDVGGGTGLHAAALIADGYDVELIDPVPDHVRIAEGAGVKAVIGDTRNLPYEDAQFDAALVFGPLYHLHAREDRVRAL